MKTKRHEVVDQKKDKDKQTNKQEVNGRATPSENRKHTTLVGIGL